MSLSRLTKITSPGIKTDTNWVGNNANFTGVTTTGTSFNVGVTTVHSTLIEAHNIKSTGIITATGAHFSGNVSIAGTFTYEDVTNVDSIGIITARSQLNVGNNIKLGNAGVITATSFVGDGSGLIGVASTDNIVTGTAATFTGGVDINSDLDVDGHTNLDNVSVSGVSTFTGNVDANDGLDVTGMLTVSSTIPRIRLIDTNTNPDFELNNTNGVFTIRDNSNAANRFTVGATGNISILKDLDVDGHTNLDNVSVAGVSTFAGDIYANSGTIQRASTGSKLIFNSSTETRFDHSSGSKVLLTFHNSGGFLGSIDAHAGAIAHYNSGNKVSAVFRNQGSVELYYDNAGTSTKRFNTTNTGINVTGNTVADGLVIDGNSDLNGDLDVDGHTNLDNVSVAGVTTFSGVTNHSAISNFDAQINVNSGYVNIQPTSNSATAPVLAVRNNTQSYPTIQQFSNTNAQSAIIQWNTTGQSGAGNFIFRTSLSGNEEFARFTKTGNFNLSKDLDVDGHTNLDNVSIAGVTTFSGNTTFGSNGLISGAANFALTSNKLRVTGSDTVGIECQRAGNATIQCTDTSNSTDLQIRANSEGGLVRTATNYPLILGANQKEKLRIAGGSYATIGINTSTFDNAGAQLKIEGRGTGTTSPPYLQIKGVGNSALHSYVDLIATSNNNDGNAYRGLGVVMHDEPTNVEWFSGRPYAGSDRFIIGRKASPSYRTQSSEAANSLLRIESSGKVGIKFNFNYTMNSQSTDLVIGDGGGGRGITLWTAAAADNQTISFQTNETLSRAEGEISYGPTATSTVADRNAMMFRTNSAERFRIDKNGSLTNTTNSSHSQGAGTFNIKGVINQYSQGSGSGLIFDCDFGRLTGYGDDTNVGNGTNLSACLAHSTTDWSSNNSNTPISVNGGTFQYRSGFGGYMEGISNGGRVSVAAGSGNPAMSDKLNTASMTIESWVWYGGGGREVICSRWGSGFPNQFNMICDPNGQFHFNNGGVGAGSGNISGEHFPDKTWHHHVWQYDAVVNTVNRWYINGAFANSYDAGSSLAVSSQTGFGIFSRGDDYERWRGKIAIVRIYNRALSAVEIKNHFELERGRFGV